MVGHRYRFNVERMFGRLNMYNVTADYRKYWFRQPISVATRVTHIGRYGQDAQNNLFWPLFLGYPGFMRGFDYNSLYSIRNEIFDEAGNFSFEKLQGTRLLVGGLELKVPFTGPERLALISSGFFFTELNWFLDAGIAWNDNSTLVFERRDQDLTDPIVRTDYRFPVFSTGPSIRINLFGALVIEPYYAIPFSLTDRWPGVWGINFWPGW